MQVIENKRINNFTGSVLKNNYGGFMTEYILPDIRSPGSYISKLWSLAPKD
jgi:hypothetical protein